MPQPATVSRPVERAALSPQAVRLAILVAALGYFVDIYDLILFSIVRIPSLRGIGVPEGEILGQGVLLLNMQMGGMLVGGIIWGILGDKRGRLTVLFGSIVLYSLANIANGFVSSVPQYALLRFIAGVGLAGELGAGITLVSEIMPAHSRGYGTMIVATVGVTGAVVASLVGDAFNWRTAYFVGGAMGLALFVLRVGVAESGMFQGLRHAGVVRGDFWSLIARPNTRWKYVRVVLIGAPIWYVIGILITLSPELGAAMNMATPPNAGRAVMFAYIGLALGDFASGGLSQLIKSRNRVVGLFVGLTTLFIAAYFTIAHLSLTVFYVVCLLLGVAVGYWAVFVTIASEQFGTNIRATVTTTAPNFVRGSLVLLTMAFQALRPLVGIQGSAMIVGAVALAIAYLSLWGLEETYGKDLDYLELP
ncbi:MAG: MFS transporter [Acidobacteria bacterium RIFCSPLOWO2_12_FULL_65_11]|nr:MAG: MFS transporter [Acidobacteria bacterium RIFCSPLOWO2_02_FULL_64_15]OFW33066.1 MAG: MFS transporter [Acidobacteria bacterium RIFCSPLOWO2_12_FULL_65_11]